MKRIFVMAIFASIVWSASNTAGAQGDACKISNPAGTFTINRPSIFAVSPKVIPVLDRRPVTVTGRFYSTRIYLTLSQSFYKYYLGPFPVSKLASKRPPGGDPLQQNSYATDFVTFDLPSDIRSGEYRLEAGQTTYRNCYSQELITLTITPPEPGPLWFVATLKSIEVSDPLEPRQNFPAEARFAMGGQSKTPSLENKRTAQFPAGAYLGLHDGLGDGRQKLYPDVPIFWDLKQRMGPEFALTLAGYERDGSAYPDWAGPVLAAVGGAVGCYAGGLSGCATGVEIASKAAELIKKELDDDDDFYGSLGVTCNQDSNYCIGSGTGYSSIVKDYTLPMDSPDPNLKLEIEYRMIEAPRLQDVRVTLRDLRLFHGTAHNDDDWKKGGEDIWIRYRVAPLHLAEQELNTARSLPGDAPEKTLGMCTSSEQEKGCTLPSWLLFSDSEGLLFPIGDEDRSIRDENGVPALYVEISVWESDGGDSQHLIGLHSAIYWMSDLMRDRAEYKTTIGAAIESVYAYGCDEPFACGVAVERTQGWIAYDLEIKRAAPGR